MNTYIVATANNGVLSRVNGTYAILFGTDNQQYWLKFNGKNHAAYVANEQLGDSIYWSVCELHHIEHVPAPLPKDYWRIGRNY